MSALELILLIGVAVLAGEVAAQHLRLPPPLVLLVIGSGLSYTPGLRNGEPAPNVVLFIFLPALVYWESLNNISLREIRDNLRIIVLTGVGLSLATTLCVAAAASALGLAWPLFVLTGLRLHSVATALDTASSSPGQGCAARYRWPWPSRCR